MDRQRSTLFVVAYPDRETGPRFFEVPQVCRTRRREGRV